jgi:hypothetical protein
MDWINLTQYRGQWEAVVHMATNLEPSGSIEGGEVLSLATLASQELLC